jgi:hypothetical protein
LRVVVQALDHGKDQDGCHPNDRHGQIYHVIVMWSFTRRSPPPPDPTTTSSLGSYSTYKSCVSALKR